MSAQRFAACVRYDRLFPKGSDPSGKGDGAWQLGTCFHRRRWVLGRSFADLYVFRLPQNVGAHWCARIGSAGFTMAVAHLYWRACYLDLHQSTETGTRMRVIHIASKKRANRCRVSVL